MGRETGAPQRGDQGAQRSSGSGAGKPQGPAHPGWRRFARIWKTVCLSLSSDSVDQANDDQAAAIFRIRRFAIAALVAAIVVCIALFAFLTYRGGRLSALPKGNGSSSATSKAVTKSDGGDRGKSATQLGADKLAAAPPAAKTMDTKPSLVSPLSDQERAGILAQAQATAAASGKPAQQFSYCVAGKGNVGETDSFASAIFRTLNDPRGWPRAGATFVQGSDGACDMTIVLSEAQYLPTFSPSCSSTYSCRVGNQVIINKDRWDGGTDLWLGAGGDMERYKVMVINHEVGHRLGHMDNEQTCAAQGQPAPLMQEQSMGLDGCTPNEWPLDSELWVR
ncbi:hypothetical protein KIM372_04370 [Bombiscardovia nodaiensis]|uniref:DUF3152 domain-containing protein n=1 Tax=Bombiscardovia nodaiensis TaxID=2932181 RepID=A0ABM8B713_9BIFI|nr:hypothetical protein KIM372_04370 [Bombiscardovia nodaiensis]